MGVSTSPEFRAPPPSPVGSHRRRRGANQDILSEFLDKYSGRGIPNLVSPNYDKGEALVLFPNKQRFLVNLPTFDFRLLSLHDLLDAVSDIGCFQLINHGVPQATLTRALENYTILDDENTEEIVVYKDVIDDDHHFQAEGHVCNYSEIIRELMGEAERIGKVIVEKLGGKCNQEDDDDQEEEGVRVCYVKKHNHRKKQTEEEEEAIRVMMMMRRGYDERHSLCLNFCDETEFHVYSKLRGLVSFSTLPHAVVVTLGDHYHHHHHHAWNGVFKGVFGRPFLLNNCHHLHQRDLVSLSFLYTSSGTHNNNNNKKEKEKRKKKKIISISQQLLFTLFFILFLPFFFP